jgi:polar amino acid transport system substrate-binding protein
MRTRLAAFAVAAAALLAGCAGTSDTPLPPETSSPQITVKPPAAQTCTNFRQSYAPQGELPAAGQMPSGSKMAEIQRRGRLIAGVSADSYLLGSRNPLTDTIEGFDIDLVHEIADAILGPNAKVELRVITAADRIPVLQKKQVDIVVRNMTVNCDRWKQVAFSAVYYEAGQKLLIRKGVGITGFGDLDGKRVCAPLSTTSMDNLVRLAPKSVPVGAANHSGCLVDLQQGDADAITGDDTVLAGLAAQDPYAQVLQGKAVTQEPYGVAMNAEDIDLARFVNGVLEKSRTDGAWIKSYNRWLLPTLGKASGVQPTPQYGRG